MRGASSGSQTPPPPPPSSPPPPSPAPSSGVPFGLYSLPTSELASYSGSVQSLTPATVLTTARAARQAGARLIVRLADSDVVNGDGTFSLDKWKAAVDRYASVDLSSFINDGTITGHLLVQNPQDAGLWGRRAISHATIEEMARYSRQRWPGLPTIAHAPATWLAANATPWQYLDASSVMYKGSYGDAAAWVAGQASAAGKARLGLLVGMNALNGGTSASGLPGVTQGMYAMSASQLGSWGSAVLAESRVCGLMLSRHDAAYFGRSDVKASVATLAAKSLGRATTSCRVRA